MGENVAFNGRNKITIHADFAKHFWLDPTGEIKLNQMGEIMLKYVSICNMFVIC